MTSKTDPKVLCLSCNQAVPLSLFRVFTQAPLRFFEFCAGCEEAHGIKSLYLRYKLSVDPALYNYVVKTPDATILAAEDAISSRRQALKHEMARRELARRRLIYFVKQMFPQYKAGWVHNDICRRLEHFMHAVEQGKAPRLVLNVPPRHGKSALASDYFPSWVLGHHPEWEIIATSYALSLPVDFSRNIRQRIKDPAYTSIFPNTQLAEDSQAVEAWKTTKRGAFTCAGVGGPILGKGAHVLIIDDPHKNAEEAGSEQMRGNAHSWYSSTARTRLAPGGGVLIIQQRWHDDDLTGHQLSHMKELLDQGAAIDEIDYWEVITYPALAEEDEYLYPDGSIVRAPDEPVAGARLLRKAGEALHPERYDVNALTRLKNTLPRDEWNALFQQNPVPDDGEFFSKHDIRYVPHLPGHIEEYTFLTAWDFAIGEKQTNDWTVGTVGAVNAKGDLYVVDMVRGRLGTRQIIEAIMTFLKKYPIYALGMEDGQIKKTLAPLVLEELNRTKSSVMIDDTLKPVTDKKVRAQHLGAMVQRGQFYVLSQPWADKMVGEMLRFPKGQHDDIVDSLAWLARMTKTAPLPTLYNEGNQRKSWKDRVLTGAGGRRGRDSYMTA